MAFVPRILDLLEILKQKSCFLFGPRQTGKTTLIRHTLKPDRIYNLLESDTFAALSRSPKLLREEIQRYQSLVIIDEIQKLPQLLDEVHNLIEQKKIRFLLTGSSARKLRRGGVNLLGGRARHRILHPFVFKELDHFDLIRALTWGLIPSIYFSNAPLEDLKSYVGDYLREEIANEGLTRNVPAFSRFLEVAALCNGQLINYTKIANDAQVARTTVQEYFQILKDTLIAYELRPWKKTQKRKPLSTSKFFFFDVGIMRNLQGGEKLQQKSPEFGAAFETFIFHELQAFCDYTQRAEIFYWRSKSGFEVDFILNDSTAIEVKGKRNLSLRDFTGLRALKEEKKLKEFIVISLDDYPRKMDQITVLPWKIFLQRLWEGDLSL